MKIWRADEDITGCRTFESLPQAAQDYVTRIEELMGVPIVMVSVGPEREQTSFEANLENYHIYSYIYIYIYI